MKPIERFEQLIRDLHVLDINTSAEMDRQILHDTLKVQKERKKTKSAGNRPDIWRTIMKNPITKLAAVIGVVLGVGAIAVVGVNVGRYYYLGQNDKGLHVFVSEDEQSVDTLGPDEVTDIEQTRRDLEEIESLRQQDKRELLKVEETTTDGTLQMRVHVYKYELSDGRTIDNREGAGGEFALDKAKMEEYFQLRKAGPGEDLGSYEETVEGRVFSFKREKYILSDGTEIIYSLGTPKDDQ
jgi:hypothetical protein